jgi:hypothetical protein
MAKYLPDYKGNQLPDRRFFFGARHTFFIFTCRSFQRWWQTGWRAQLEMPKIYVWLPMIINKSLKQSKSRRNSLKSSRHPTSNQESNCIANFCRDQRKSYLPYASYRKSSQKKEAQDHVSTDPVTYWCTL